MLATDRQMTLYRARELWQQGFVCFDTETTGLELGYDEIIQWAVVDHLGNVLGSGFCKPTVEISEGAFEKHGITKKRLVDAPSFAEVWASELRELLMDKTLVIYNADFDLRMLRTSLRVHSVEPESVWSASYCAMNLFAILYGSFHEYWMNYTWQSLETATTYFKIEVEGHAHEAAHDAAVTAHLIRCMAELADKQLPADWHPPIKVKCYGKCDNVVKEFWEETPWYCHECGLRLGLYHHCPRCNQIVKAPSTGILLDDLCWWCHKKAHQDKMLVMKLYHYCPTHRYGQKVVETSDPKEPCHDCKEQRKYREFMAEEERKRQEKIAKERKEAKRVYNQEYRKKKKEEARINQERIEQELPPLEKPALPDPYAPFTHHGHHFQREKLNNGQTRVVCSICTGWWSRPPKAQCNGIKTYWSWKSIPENLKTQTQLRKLHLKLSPGQQRVALMETSYNIYRLYDQQKCIPTRSRAKV